MKRFVAVFAVAVIVAGAAIGQLRIDVLEVALIEKARGDEAAFIAALKKTVVEEDSFADGADRVAFVESLLANLGLEPDLIAETAAVQERQELYDEWTERFEETFTIGGQTVSAKTIIKALEPKEAPVAP